MYSECALQPRDYLGFAVKFAFTDRPGVKCIRSRGAVKGAEDPVDSRLRRAQIRSNIERHNGHVLCAQGMPCAPPRQNSYSASARILSDAPYSITWPIMYNPLTNLLPNVFIYSVYLHV